MAHEFKSSPTNSKDAIIDTIAGINGGIANVYVGQSLDTVKVKLQTFPQLYKSTVDCFYKTWKADGIRGLYAGTVPALAANIAENSVLFCVQGICMKGVATLLGKPNATPDEVGVFGSALAGSGGGAAAAFVLCPTELVKCRLQAMLEMRNLAASSATIASAPGDIAFTQVRAHSTFASTASPAPSQPAHNQVRLLHTHANAYNSTRFNFSSDTRQFELRRFLRSPYSRSIHTNPARLTGALPRPLSANALYPKIGPISVIREILASDGPLGFFRGLMPTFAREVPGYFFFFGGYEFGRFMFSNMLGVRRTEIGPSLTAVSGGLGGVFLWSVIFPFDVIKSRMQIAHGPMNQNRSMVSTLLHIGRTEGYRALYAGLAPTLIRSFVASGALFVAVEYSKQHLHFFFD